jgi:nitroreductase
LSVEQVREVVEAATLAPSVHNTQPWRFGWDGAVLSVHEDPSRGLPVLDPEGRERLLSCGAAILNARLTLSYLGRGATVTLLPDDADPALLAVIEVGGPRAADEGERALALEIPRRHTDRGVFDPRPVPREVLARLEEAAEQERAWARPVESPDDRVTLAVLLSHANEIEQSDPAYQEELARWRTRARAAEGIPDAALGEPPTARASEFPLRDFTGGSAERPHGDEPPPAEHPLALVIGTREDERQDRLLAGMALGRVLLQASAEGLAASPMTQVVEIDRLRLRLRSELRLVGMPQVVLRLGYGTAGLATRRRPVDEVLELTL